MNKFNKITFIATKQMLLITYNGKRTQITKHEKPDEYQQLCDLIKAGDEEGIIKRINGSAQIVEEHSSGLFKIDHENRRIIDSGTNTEVELRLGKRIVEWANAGLPFEPLLNFHRRVIKNPSKDSANDLFTFLEKNKIPITTEGKFLTYKRVNRNSKGDLVDCRTGKFDNNPGATPRMDRKDVNPDRNQTCSSGLHVCGYSYLGSFSGDAIVECEVDPEHVVSVPTDYNAAKMRCCEYKVLRVVQERETERTAKMVKVETPAEPSGEAKIVEGLDLTSMKAQEIKDYIKENYGVEITTNNKDKKGIITKANKIIAGLDVKPAAPKQDEAKDDVQNFMDTSWDIDDEDAEDDY